MRTRLSNSPLSSHSSPCPGAFIHTLTSIPFLKVKRISSQLYTVAYSTRLYQSSSSNSVSEPSFFSSSVRNRPVFFRFAIRSVMAEPTTYSRSFILSKRSASPSYFFWYSVWSRATQAFSFTHCCILSATMFISSWSRIRSASSSDVS